MLLGDMKQVKRKLSNENYMIIFPVPGERLQGGGRPRELESSPWLAALPQKNFHMLSALGWSTLNFTGFSISH